MSDQQVPEAVKQALLDADAALARLDGALERLADGDLHRAHRDGGELGATWSRWGERLVPIATLYDPFLSRALEPWSFGLYAGGQSILVGTPSGVTLSPEGGAHQSVSTPSIGIEQPACTAWEPAFAQDLEWCFLHAMREVGVPGGTSAYFRLSTRPVEPALARVPDDDVLRERRRRQVVSGGYRVTTHAVEDEQVTLVGTGP